MAKTLDEFRAQNLRLLKQIGDDDPDYIANWMREFDERHGIKVPPSPCAPREIASRLVKRPGPSSVRPERPKRRR